MDNASKDNDQPVTQSDDGSVLSTVTLLRSMQTTVQARMQTKLQRKIQTTISLQEECILKSAQTIVAHPIDAAASDGGIAAYPETSELSQILLSVPMLTQRKKTLKLLRPCHRILCLPCHLLDMRLFVLQKT
jgi:hypothetical protein